MPQPPPPQEEVEEETPVAEVPSSSADSQLSSPSKLDGRVKKTDEKMGITQLKNYNPVIGTCPLLSGLLVFPSRSATYVGVTCALHMGCQRGEPCLSQCLGPAGPTLGLLLVSLSLCKARRSTAEM